MLIKDLQFRQTRKGLEAVVTTDDDAVSTLDAEVAVRFRLARGMDISEELLAKICHENEFLLAKRKLINYLALRKKTTADAAKYLRRAEFSISAIDAATDYAKNLGYLDDRDYAEAFVRTRAKAGAKGPRVVSKELQAKGIPSDEAKRAVRAIATPEAQLESARRVAAKKYPSLKDEANLIKAARRMSQHLARRGFDHDVCENVTREFFGEPTQF